MKPDLEQRQSNRVLKKTISSGKLSPAKAIDIETILVPIDFSSASLQTIRWAKFIARRTGAGIHLVHVHDFEHSVSRNGGTIRTSAKAIQNWLYRDLKDVARRYNVSNATARCHILTGHAFEQICKLAAEIHVDLIVMSTHGRTGWQRVLLGSTAERVVQHAPCPVLIVRQSKTSQKHALKLKKIAVPVDFSDCSVEGLTYALKLARGFGAELLLLHALHIYHYSTPVVVYTVAELNRFAREGAKERMRELARGTNFGGVKVETVIKMGRQTGSSARTICHYAEKISADLIVTSTHGRTGLPHVLIGSVAEQIVRYAKTPVLVVPTRAKQQHHFSH
jgi:nucleotide-binding universal stress UspA family protein